LDGLRAAGHVHGVAGLRAACPAAAPLTVIGPFVLAAAACGLLLTVESRVAAPLVDLGFFTRLQFVMGVAIGRALCPGTAAGAGGTFASTDGPGFGHGQCLHVPGRQRRRRLRSAAFALGGFVAVSPMIALAGLIGAALSRAIPETA